MSYINYYDTFSVPEAEADQWYDTIELMRTLIAIKQTNLSNKAAREQCHGTLALPAVAPFAENRRFPLGRRYIRGTDQPWLGLMSQLRAALTHSDREAELAPGQSSDMRHRAVQDATRAITGAIDSMLMTLRQRHASYDRPTFERRYELRWVDGRRAVDFSTPPREPPMAPSPSAPGLTVRSNTEQMTGGNTGGESQGDSEN